MRFLNLRSVGAGAAQTVVDTTRAVACSGAGGGAVG